MKYENKYLSTALTKGNYLAPNAFLPYSFSPVLNGPATMEPDLFQFAQEDDAKVSKVNVLTSLHLETDKFKTFSTKAPLILSCTPNSDGISNKANELLDDSCLEDVIQLNFGEFKNLPASPLDEYFHPISNCFMSKNPWDDFESVKKIKNKHIHPEDALLTLCGQKYPIPLDKIFDNLFNTKKIGEGASAEVYTGKFSNSKSSKFIYKLVPTGGKQLICGRDQVSLENVKQELIVAQLLNTLRNSQANNYTTAFCHLYRARVVHGQYPKSLIDACKEWSDKNESDWSNTDFDPDQKYLLLEFEHVGKSIEEVKINNAKTAYFALMQMTFALAAAEMAIEFEHRDLHLANILVKRTNAHYQYFKIKGKQYKIPTLGWKTSIIDYTYARSTHPEFGTTFFDLSTRNYADMFRDSQSSYQFQVYRKMQELNGNQWNEYVPKSNVYWLHYLVKKMVTGKDIKYKNIRSQTHKKFIGKLQYYSRIIKKYDSAAQFVTETRTGKQFAAK